MWSVPAVVPGAGVTGRAMLSDYFAGLKGTPGDTEVYILDSGVPGGTAFVLGGTHSNEPSGLLTATVLVESGAVTQGKLIVIPYGNRSGFTCTDPQEGAPQRFTVDMADGSVREFAYGSETNPLHQLTPTSTSTLRAKVVGKREPQPEQGVSRPA